MQAVDILAIGVHPDDIELSCSGTLIKHIEKGYTVGLCDLTQGELGSRGSADIRLQEATAAQQIIGAAWRINLGMHDGFFYYDKQHLLRIIEVIRAARPKIVLANATSDRHPDHGRAAKLAADACFYSGLLKIQTKYDGEIQKHHRPAALYHYVQDRNIPYDFVVDISDHMAKKMDCIRAYGTQFAAVDGDGPQTPISTGEFIEYMYAKNKAYGRDINAKYAEAFIKVKDIGIDDLLQLR